MTSDHVLKAIAALDLETIKIKLMHKSGQRWSQARADATANEYRRFLHLQHAYPGEPCAPTADVDTFWHYHILDTMKYAADCEQVFGRFLHHYPYVGMLDDEEGAEIAASERTKALYEATFGEPYDRAAAYASDADGIAAPRAVELVRCSQMCTALLAPNTQRALVALAGQSLSH